MAVYTSPNDGSTLDSFLRSGATTTNENTNAENKVGEHNAIADAYRTLIQFPGIQAGVLGVVSTAFLYMKIYLDRSSNARTMRVFRIKRDVVITQVTWNIWKTGSNWSTAGGFHADDCEQTDIGSIDLTATETPDTWKSIELDGTAIQEIVDGSWTTPTLLIKMDTETDDGYMFYSSNHTTASNRPYIVVNSTILTPVTHVPRGRVRYPSNADIRLG